MLNFFDRLGFWLEPKRRKSKYFNCGHCCLNCKYFSNCFDEFYALDIIRATDFKKPLKISIDK